MILITWTDWAGQTRECRVEAIKLWEARGGGRDHPDGTVVEGYREGRGVLQLDVNDRVGNLFITGVER